MTSNYAEKRRTAVCAYANCDVPAKTLVMVRGRLEWVCTYHKEKK